MAILSQKLPLYQINSFKGIGVTQLDFNYLNLLDVEKYHNQFIFIKISWLNFNCVTPKVIWHNLLFIMAKYNHIETGCKNHAITNQNHITILQKNLLPFSQVVRSASLSLLCQGRKLKFLHTLFLIASIKTNQH